MDYRTMYEPVAREAARLAGIDENIFVALIHHESGWNPQAISADGAVGIAQIVPWAHPDTNPRNPEMSLRDAARWIRKYRDNHDGSYEWALFCYNAGVPFAESHAFVPQWELDRYVLPILNHAAKMATPTASPTLEVEMIIGTPTPVPAHVGTATPTPPGLLVFLAIAISLLFRKS
jgi:soluble lytic murein transglycosylase-like protein